MENQNLFKWKHYLPGIILLTVRWYLGYIFNLTLNLIKIRYRIVTLVFLFSKKTAQDNIGE